MSENGWSKLKILYILELLNKESDENNILPIASIVEKLETFNISTERKSVIRDIKLLIQYGYDISIFEENGRGYYMRSRHFQPYEIHFLIDAVQASKAITYDDSAVLLNKLKAMTSQNVFNSIRNCAFIQGGSKGSNTEFYNNLEKIKLAINEDRQIELEYSDFEFNSMLNINENITKLKLSPYFLYWKDDNYFMKGSLENSNIISNFRLDKITKLEISNDIRKLISTLKNYNSISNYTEYSANTKYAINGVLENLELKCSNSILDTVIDKFGSYITLIKEEDDSFILRTTAIIDDSFITWAFSQGINLEILSPSSARRKLIESSEAILNQYYQLRIVNKAQ